MAVPTRRPLTDDEEHDVETYPVPSGDGIEDAYLREVWDEAARLVNEDDTPADDGTNADEFAEDVDWPPADDPRDEEDDDEPAYDLSSAQLDLTGSAAELVLAYGDSLIEDDDLADFGREDEPHVTLLYGLETEDPREVYPTVADFGMIRVRLGKTGVFPARQSEAQRGGAQYDVVYVAVEGEDLHKLNDALAELPHTDTFPDYVPHVTLAYVLPGTGEKYAGDDALEGTVLDFGKVTFSPADGERVPMPLSRLTFSEHATFDEGDWQPYSGPRGGKGWINKKTGRVLYGTRKPSAGGGKDQSAAAPRAEDMAGKLREVMHKQVSAKDVQALAKQLKGMSAGELTQLKKTLGIRAGGRREDVAAKIAQHVKAPSHQAAAGHIQHLLDQGGRGVKDKLEGLIAKLPEKDQKRLAKAYGLNTHGWTYDPDELADHIHRQHKAKAKDQKPAKAPEKKPEAKPAPAKKPEAKAPAKPTVDSAAQTLRDTLADFRNVSYEDIRQRVTEALTPLPAYHVKEAVAAGIGDHVANAARTKKELIRLAIQALHDRKGTHERTQFRPEPPEK